VSVYFWERAEQAVDRRRAELIRRDVPEDENDPVWRELDKLAWLEQFAKAAHQMADDAEIF
jgi:hypothetical protein